MIRIVQGYVTKILFLVFFAPEHEKLPNMHFLTIVWPYQAKTFLRNPLPCWAIEARAPSFETMVCRFHAGIGLEAVSRCFKQSSRCSPYTPFSSLVCFGTVFLETHSLTVLGGDLANTNSLQPKHPPRSLNTLFFPQNHQTHVGEISVYNIIMHFMFLAQQHGKKAAYFQTHAIP